MLTIQYINTTEAGRHILKQIHDILKLLSCAANQIEVEVNAPVKYHFLTTEKLERVLIKATLWGLFK